MNQFDIKAVAVATLVDLIHVTKSMHGDSSDCEDTGGVRLATSSTSSVSPASFVVFPTLSKEQLDFLNEKTFLYKVRQSRFV